ncbi:MAG TPA: aminoglycoside phosphotransferase family protein [Mycobacterium sp.]|nr:aminoglycoside phosphotransferase family protein [Mycobacterium sp.]
MPDAQISYEGDVVLKLHRPGTDPQALRRRLRVAVRSAVLASPLTPEPQRVDGRWLTRWPRLEMVRPDPACLPWRRAGELLAQLHAEPVGDLGVGQGAPDRLHRALSRLGDGPNSDVIRRAAAGLDVAADPDRPITLVHGDFHLGQMGVDGATWQLIDVDDLGIGDPVWDLARPAGFWAAGLVPDDDWHRFLDGYRGAGGPALPDGDPWPVLEQVARAAVVAAAANHPDDDLLVSACERMG